MLPRQPLLSVELTWPSPCAPVIRARGPAHALSVGWTRRTSWAALGLDYKMSQENNPFLCDTDEIVRTINVYNCVYFCYKHNLCDLSLAIWILFAL